MIDGAVPVALRLLIEFVAGVAAGVANGVAGGGTFITFPTLLALGVPALSANLTTTVGVVPSYVGSIRVFREPLLPHRALLRFLIPWAVLGTGIGTTLLLTGSPDTFRRVVPWLIGAGTLVFALAPLVTRRLAGLSHDHPARRVLLASGAVVVAAYGGYFGAGLGILLLAALAVSLPLGVPELQGLRNALSLVINVVAAAVFLVHGGLVWTAVVMLLAGTFVGGYFGAWVVKRLSPVAVRAIVVAIGTATTIKLALGS